MEQRINPADIDINIAGSSKIPCGSIPKRNVNIPISIPSPLTNPNKTPTKAAFIINTKTGKNKNGISPKNKARKL